MIRKRLSKNTLILLVIFVLALVLRLYNLDTLPLGFHRDEIMNGYVGRFILQNGVDLYGNSWPLLYFNNFGDYPNVVPMYLSGLFTYILGSNPFAVRFPIALLGALTVFPLYGLIRQTFKKQWLAHAGALLLAITPWHIVFSRATAEGITAAFVFLSAVWLLIQGLRRRHVWHLCLSIALFALTYLLYPSYRILVPLTWLAVPLLAPTRRMKMGLALVTVLFFTLTIGISQTQWGKGRFEQTSIWATNQDVDAQTQRFVYGSGDSPVWVTRMFHNKAIVGGREFVHQYMSYFSGEFLLSRGGLPVRYVVPDQGLLFYGAAIFLLLLVVSPRLLRKFGIESSQEEILTEYGKDIFAFLIWIILLIPVPSALTRDDVPNTHRTLLLSVMYVLPVLYGIARVSSWRLRKMPQYAIVPALLACVIAVEFVYFVRVYTVHADAVQTLDRHDENRKVVEYVLENEKEYDRVLLSSRNQMALHYLLEKGDYSSEYAGRFGDEIYINKVENIEFYSTDCPSQEYEAIEGESALVIDSATCQDLGLDEVQRIQSALHLDAYRVLQDK